MNRFQFVADHQRRYGVKQLCSIVGIARSSFYYWRVTAADRAARWAADAALAARIRAVHRESDGTYGVPRITAELREDGERVNHKRISRVPSTRRSNARPSRAASTGPASTRPVSTRSAGSTATTPDAVIPTLDNGVPSPTRQHSTRHQLPWPKPHSSCPRSRVKARAL